MDVFVVSHTHWDREWYHGAARFRQRLVPLVDELLDAPEPLAPSFLLDGQAVVLEDYLSVRPERRARLAHALAEGRLEAGPWYVLADQLLPGAESHVRNLLAGRAVLRALGAEPPPVLYSPDAFGHAAASPRLAAGFGFPVAIVWRGYGGRRWPAGDAAWWEAESGERVVLYHLAPQGYELGSSLPADAELAGRHWTALRAILAPRALLDLVYLPNGADHHALQRDAAAAVRALALRAAPADQVRWTSLRDLAARIHARAGEARLPLVRGELRDSYGYTWTLQGTLATRAHQKRRAARAERDLVRDVEPWLALSALSSDPGARALLGAAWRTLLRCQPHDTLCGCSTDEVAAAMDDRLRSVGSQAAGLRATGIHALLGHDPVAARERRDEWRPALVVRNAAPRERGGVAEVELLHFVADVPVGPGSAGAPSPASIGGPPAVPTVDGGRIRVQPLHSLPDHDMTESPRAYPDCDLVWRTRALAWLPPQEGYSLRAYPLGSGSQAPAADDPQVAPPTPTTAGSRWLDNGRLRVEVASDGRVSVVTREGRAVHDLIELEDVPDRGDSYTHSPGGDRMRWTRADSVRVVASGPLRSALALEFRPMLPASRRTRAGEPARQSVRQVECPVTIRLSLDAGSDVLGIEVRGRNRARDHRLRLLLRTEVRDGDVLADAAFGAVRREPILVPAEDLVMERPPATAPLHRWVGLHAAAGGATLFSDGLAEYEAGGDGTIAVTLVRAIGQLSSADLPERPGHAGWPVAIPGAQCLGPMDARFGLLLHGPRDAALVGLVERTADDVLVPLRGETLRSALDVPIAAGGATLTGVGLGMSAIKPADDPAWRLALRCVNLLPESVEGAWELGVPMAEACLARLDESPLSALSVVGGAVRFVAPPRAVVTILVR